MNCFMGLQPIAQPSSYTGPPFIPLGVVSSTPVFFPTVPSTAAATEEERESKMSSSASAAQHLPRTEARSLSGHEGAVLAVRFNRDGNYCLSCGKDRTLRLWNPHTGAHVKTYKSHAREVRDVHASSYVCARARPFPTSLSPFVPSHLKRHNLSSASCCFLVSWLVSGQG